jgi:hypothetical protein
VTKKYCTANLKNGGFSAGYGRSVDYWVGSACSGDTEGEVVGAYDCCTTVVDGVREFVLGRTLATDVRELMEGDVEGFGSRWGRYMERLGEQVGSGVSRLGEEVGSGVSRAETLQKHDPGLAAMINFVCDPRLKQGILRIASNVLGPSTPIHGYKWKWNQVATRLYGLEGEARGMLTTEVEKVFPFMVNTGPHGYHHLSITPAADVDSCRVYAAMIKLIAHV